jgi:hypothetical protein
LYILILSFWTENIIVDEWRVSECDQQWVTDDEWTVSECRQFWVTYNEWRVSECDQPWVTDDEWTVSERMRGSRKTFLFWLVKKSEIP